MNRTAALPALLLSLGLALTGCGGGGDDEEAAPEPISKADFTTQANKICADGSAELDAAADALGDAPTQEQIEGFAADTLVPNIQAQHDDIEALGAPEGDEDEVDAILAALQDGVDATEADPSAITSGDPFAQANELAGAYGLTDCAD